MKNTLFALALAPSLVWAVATVPEHVENKAFDPAKPPVVDEARPSDTFSAAEWKKASALKLPACGAKGVWKTTEQSAVQGIATKEKSVQVKGKFSRFAGFGVEQTPGLKGSGVLDLSSWDSGLVPRDYRVQKYVFGVEQKGKSVLPFQFNIETWTPSEGDWESPLTLSFKFNGIAVNHTFPVKLHADGKMVKVATAETKRFTFLNTAGLKAFEKMMALCNHHYLASFADISLDLVFEDACAKE